MIDVKCVICNDKIKKPRIGHLCCEKEKCKDEFNANMVELWKLQNPEKVKESNRKSNQSRAKKAKPKGL